MMDSVVSGGREEGPGDSISRNDSWKLGSLTGLGAADTETLK